MISNQLIIRLEKNGNRRRKRLLKEWDPPCDCVEIQRPTSKKGPKIVNADYDDRIVFRMHSASRFHGKEESVKSQTIAYKTSSCTEKEDGHRCKTITVYPQFTSGSQEVYSDHITEGGQDVFLLRIKKRTESTEQSDRNVELEVRTPRPPTVFAPRPPQPPPISDSAAENVKKPRDDDTNNGEGLDKVWTKKQETRNRKQQPKKRKKAN